MALIVLSKKECRRDRICIAECPYGIINADASGFPKVEKKDEKFCILCGHCVIVCPNGALSLSKMSAENCIEVRNELSITPEEAEQFLKSRRSIRSYDDKSVPRKVLNRLIDTTRWASSAMNRQPVHWLIVERRSEVRNLANIVVNWMRERNYQPKLIAAFDQGTDTILHDAPHLAVAHAPKDNFWSTVDCVIGLTYMELGANALGLGACWAGLLTRVAKFYPPLTEAMNLPSGHIVCGALMLGYPRYHFRLIPQRKRAKVKWR